MSKYSVPVLAILALLLGARTARADITNNLVAYYNFEGMAGLVGETVVDQTGHGHDGICRQDQSTLRAPTLVAGPTGMGTAMSFDGNFYVQIPNHADFNITDSITVAAWISVDTFDQAWQTVFCRGDWSWRLHRSNGSDYGAFHMTAADGSYITVDGATTSLRVPKRWLHLVGTYQSGAGDNLYINGALEASSPGATGFINTNGSDPVTIGAWINGGSLARQWKGQIDEVRIYHRALSAADIAELYAFKLGAFNSSPEVTTPGELDLNVPTNVQMTAIVSDDGMPLPANPANPATNDPNKLRWGWSVRSQPIASKGIVWTGNATNGEAFTYQGSPQPPWTLFTNNPTAAFDVPGMYVLQFSATDGQRTNRQTVIVRVQSRNDYRPLGYAYLSPLPGAEYTLPQTSLILVRFSSVSPAALTNLAGFIQVTGAKSGLHAGTARIAADGRTVMFQMNTGFAANEAVTVSLAPGVPAADGGPLSPYQYQFMVSSHWPDSAPQWATAAAAPAAPPPAAPTPAPQLQTLAASKGVAGILPNGVSVPSDFPWITIATNNHPDPDPIFIDNRGGGGDAFNVIFGNNGNPVWYMRMPDERRDMKVQHNGVMTMMARDNGWHFNGFDNHYRQVAQYWGANGYGCDEHELQVLADGTYLLLTIGSGNVDMSRYVAGGNTAASVTECALQEFTSAGELIFQWRAWDHFNILDQQSFIDLTSASFDFPHMNAIDVDTDGNLLLSSRSTSEITKINRDTGDILWRLGGAHGQFTFVNDPLNGPRNQHAVRRVTTNDYTMFDNGNLHSPSMSRGVEYVLDTNRMTATLVWQYPNPPVSSIYSFYMGDVQRLTNGNTLINWAVGNLPKLTEVCPDGSKAFEMNWADQWEAYRTWRCPWQGSALSPCLIVEPYPDNVTLIYNQFGDTNVAFYRLYGGTAPHPTNLLATSGATLKQLTTLASGSNYYFRVTAVNRQGVEGPYSNETNTLVNIIKPGQNMVQNGDFSQGTSAWGWTLSGGATAAWAIESGVSHVYITNGTATLANIQLTQTGQPVVLGKTYVFQFDAWAAQPRYIQAMVAQDASPNLNYSGTTSTYLTPAHNHFRYVFTMAAATDFNAGIFFNLGGSASGVYLDNVSLFNAPPGDLNADGQVNLLDLQLLTHDWLKQQGGLNTDLDGNGTVDFSDFSILGENWSGGN